MGEVPGTITEVAPTDSDDFSQKRRIKHSGWFITINTNVSADKEGGGEVLEQLREAMAAIFDPQNLFLIIDVKEEGVLFNGNTVHDTSTVFSIEIGKASRGRRIHAHALLHVYHHTMIHLSHDGLLEQLHLHVTHPLVKGFHIDWKMVRSDADILNYIEKNPA